MLQSAIVLLYMLDDVGDACNVMVILQVVQAAKHRLMMVKVAYCWEPKKLAFSSCLAAEHMCVTHG